MSAETEIMRRVLRACEVNQQEHHRHGESNTEGQFGKFGFAHSAKLTPTTTRGNAA